MKRTSVYTHKMMKEIVFLRPVHQSMMWGSEDWGISAREDGDCEIIRGKYAKHSRRWLWLNHRELFGNIDYVEFPLLVKYIDAYEDLSIQIHPDDFYARNYEKVPHGKTECWYILECSDAAEIVIGHSATSKEELATMIRNGQWEKLLKRQKIKRGDFFQIPSGTIHAIQKDTKCPYQPYSQNRKVLKKETGIIEELVNCPYYKIERVKIKGRLEFIQTKTFYAVNVIKGEGMIDKYQIDFQRRKRFHHCSAFANGSRCSAVKAGKRFREAVG